MNSMESLERILLKEIEIYKLILYMEQNKQEAILQRDGALLDTLCLEQEEVLSQLDIWEIQRDQVLDNFQGVRRSAETDNKMTLKDIISLVGEHHGKRLMRYGDELKSLVLRLARLQDLNKRLIRDNMEYFNILMSEIRGNATVPSGYDRTGKEKGPVTGSLLFNQTV